MMIGAELSLRCLWISLIPGFASLEKFDVRS